MQCPHCHIAFAGGLERTEVGEDTDGRWSFFKTICPECKRLIFYLEQYRHASGVGLMPGEIPGQEARPYTPEKRELRMIHPRSRARAPIPPQVPPEIANDYREASLVLGDSPKASAALSRRCLQNLLRSVAGVKPGDLAAEIQQVLDSRELPSRLAEAIDAVRNLGNFAAHPIKSRDSGAIVGVEVGEGEWNLDVIESLFDFYYVQPPILQQKKDSLNKKLKEAGKPPLK